MFDNSRDNSSPQEGQGGIIPLGATGSLAVFDDMRREVAEASTTAQVKDVLTQVAGLKAAARTAHNREIEANAAVIRLEAERKLGQLMKAQADTVGLNQGGGDQRSDHRDSKNPGGLPTLAEAGIDKNLAKRARKAASMSDFEFEETKKNKRETALIPVRRSPPARRRKTATRKRKSPIDPDDRGALRKLQMGNHDLRKRVAELSQEATRAEEAVEASDHATENPPPKKIWVERDISDLPPDSVEPEHCSPSVTEWVAAITLLIQSGIDAGSLFNLTFAQPPFGPRAFHDLVLRLIKIDKLWLKEARQAAASPAGVVH